MSSLNQSQISMNATSSTSSESTATAGEFHPLGCRCSPCTTSSRVTSDSSEMKNNSTSPACTADSSANAGRLIYSASKARSRFSESGSTPSMFRSYERPRRLKTDDRRRMVRRSIYGELGSASLTNQTVAASLSGVVTELNLLSEGDDVTNRTGRLVEMDSSELRWTLQLQNSGSFTAPGYVRIMLVWDKYPNQSASGTPTISTILTTTSVAAQVHSLPVFGNLDRFEVLFDQVYFAGDYTNATGTASSPMAHGSKIISLKGKYSQYQSANSSYTDLVHGGLVLVTCGTHSNGSGYDLVFDHRLRFSE